MNEYIGEIDDSLKCFLQKDIIFNINEQTYKEGKLILFTHGYFCYNFNIRNYRKNKVDILKIPYPFNIEFHPQDGLVYFDYRIRSFVQNQEGIADLVEDVKKPAISRFYDKILMIEVKHGS